MKKEDLKEFIKSVAEIEELKPKKDPNIRLDDDAEDIVRVGDEWVELTAKSNPTLGFKFIKLKDRHAVCELGCGDIVSNQVIEKRFNRTPEPHWRVKCMNCSCYVSPDGKGFIESPTMVSAAYIKYFNEKNGVQPKVKKPTEVNNSNSEIKVYEHTRPNQWVTDDQGNITFRGDSA